MLKLNAGEKFAAISFPKGSLRKKYAVSNHGRLISYANNFKDGDLLSGTLIGGYVTLKVKPNGTDKTIYVHKLVAQNFAKKSSPKHKNVIHLNHNKKDNKASNLKFVTDAEMYKHHRQSPLIKKHLSNMLTKTGTAKGLKLNVGKVKEIKKMLADKKGYTLKHIAKKFRVSDMQVFRIKTGENWASVK